MKPVSLKDEMSDSSTARPVVAGTAQAQRLGSRRTACSPRRSVTVRPESAIVIACCGCAVPLPEELDEPLPAPKSPNSEHEQEH